MKWFKHDADANMDEKLQEILLDYGLEGYGLYWYCLELIAGKISNDCVTFELRHDARIIARNTGVTVTRVEEMMKRFIELELFECSDGIITCLKMAKRLDKSMTSNPEMRALIDSVKNNHDGVMTQSEKVMQDKNRLDKNRKEKDKKKTAKAAPLPGDFEITEKMRNWANAQNFTIDISIATEKWKNAMLSKGRTYVDWTAAWRNGMLKAEEWMTGDSKAKEKIVPIHQGSSVRAMYKKLN